MATSPHSPTTAPDDPGAGGTLLAAALDYARRGLAVLPLHSVSGGSCTCGSPTCSSPGKHPRTAHGVKDATTDEATIRAWWTQHPTANIGIATGRVSGVVVLDVDGPEGAETLKALAPDKPAVLWLVSTGRGAHGYFRHPGGNIPSRRLGDGLELKSEGCYVVAPPSIHASGTAYTWKKGPGQEQAGEGNAPEWVLERVREAPAAEGADPESLPVRFAVLLKHNTGVAGLWNRDPSMTFRSGNQSDSEYAAALMHRCGYEGFTDPECLAILRAFYSRPGMKLLHPRKEELTLRFAQEGREAREAATQADRPEFGAGHERASGTSGAKVGDVKPDTKAGENGDNAPGLIITRLDTVKREKVRWLWPGYIPAGKLTLLAGNMGVGKSYLALDMIARVSRGGDWPTGEEAPGGNVILLAKEDDLADTVGPRLDERGACSEFVVKLEMRLDAKTKRPVSLTQDLDRLRRFVREADVRLIVIDPLSDYFPGKIETASDNKVREVLGPLVSMAQETGVTIVGLTHLNKKAKDYAAIYRVLNSVAFTAVPRAVFMVAPDEDDPDRRLFMPAKFNLGPTPPARAFRITGVIDDPHFEWEPNPVKVDLERAVRGPEPGEDRSAGEEAQEFLREVLKDGPVLSREIYRQAEDRDISPDRVKRAKARMKVKAYKGKDEAGEPAWYMTLPHE